MQSRIEDVTIDGVAGEGGSTRATEETTTRFGGRRMRIGIAVWFFVALAMAACDGDDDGASDDQGGAGGSMTGGSTSGGASGSSTGGSSGSGGGGAAGTGGATSGGTDSGGNSGTGGGSTGGSSGDAGSGGDGSSGDGGAPTGCMPNAEACPSTEPTTASSCEEGMAQAGIFCAYSECTTACVCNAMGTEFRWLCFPIGG